MEQDWQDLRPKRLGAGEKKNWDSFFSWYGFCYTSDPSLDHIKTPKKDATTNSKDDINDELKNLDIENDSWKLQTW